MICKSLKFQNFARISLIALIINCVIGNVNAQNNQSEKRTITGKVVDDKGLPLPYATIYISSSNNGTTTSESGEYSLEGVLEGETLIFSYIGMINKEVLISDQSVVDVTLEPDMIGLEEIVMIGYGNRKKSSLTGAIASVKGDQIARVSSSSPQDALQGALAGVTVNVSQYPGNSGGIRIRGNRSLSASNDPLVIVNGAPGSLEAISSFDIESIEVLKDASATAIYGSRGANGVILVTTKKGKGVDTQFTYNHYIGVNKPLEIDMMSGERYAQFRRDAFSAARDWTPVTDSEVFTDPRELEAIQSGEYTDWMDLLFRDGLIKNHYFSLSNRGEKTRLHLSINHNDEEGYYKTNDQKKFNFNTNIDHKFSDAISLGVNVRYENRVINGLQTYGHEFTYMNPLISPYNDDGSLNYGNDITINPANTSAYNVLANYEKGNYINRRDRNRFEVSSYLDVKLINGLTWRTNLGADLILIKSDYFYGERSYNRKGAVSQSGRRNDYSFQYNLNSGLTFNKTFNDHHVTADVLGEVTSYKFDNTSASGENQPLESLTYYNLNTNTENVQTSSSYSEWSLASGLFRVQYDYQNKYLLNFAIRADGSSRLSEGNKWDYFPSFSAGWRISSEDFMANCSWLDDLKLRVSYGEVGNTSISPYRTLALLDSREYIFGDSGFRAYRPSNVANRSLVWEVSKTINLGADFSVYEGRLSGSLEFYKTNTTDLLQSRGLPRITGFSTIDDNIGETQNKGIELTLKSDLIRGDDFNYTINTAFARNWEEIVDLYLGQDNINAGWFIGQPLSVMRDFVFDGVYQLGEEAEAAVYGLEPGDVRVKDLNDDGSINEDDKVILGQRNPKWTASMRHFLNYNNWDLSIMINAEYGNIIRPDYYSGLLWGSGDRWMFDHFDYWTPTNPTNRYPRADDSQSESRYKNTAGYMKGDYIKLQQVSLGYTFKELDLKFVNLSRARIYGEVRNPLYLYKAAEGQVQPDSQGLNFNIARTFIFGVNVNF